MLSEPTLEDREEVLYVAVGARVAMSQLGPVAAPLIPEVFGWLDKHGVAPAGPPFFRYLLIDMAKELEVEVGVPVAVTAHGDDRVRPGAFPAGRYATALHTGHPDELVGATAVLLDWARRNGVTWQASESSRGEVWAARAEFYLTDPSVERDMAKWQTQLAFLTADDAS